MKPDMATCVPESHLDKDDESDEGLTRKVKKRVKRGLPMDEATSSSKRKIVRKCLDKEQSAKSHTASTKDFKEKLFSDSKDVPVVSQITFEDCPFPSCPIVVQTTEFEHHKEICPFNTSAITQIFYCLFIGCKKRFKSKEDLLGHYKKCFFSLPGDLQKELQLEITAKGVKIK